MHVTSRVLPIGSLRRRTCYRVVRRALAEGGSRPDFRVVEFSVQTSHIHLICEAEDRASLSRGLQGLFIRIAKALNKALGRKGKVFADRYQDRVLTHPRQVRNALAYVLNNFRRHAADHGRRLARGWLDPCSSAADFDGWKGRALAVKRLTGDPPLPRARTWLLGLGWKSHGKIHVDTVPGPIG